MTQLSQDNQVDECRAEDICREHKVQSLVLLSLSILISGTPNLYGHFAFVKEGIIKNDFMFAIALPLLSLILMVAAVVVAWRVTRGTCPVSIPLLGEKRQDDFLGIVILSVCILLINMALRYIFERLRIPSKDGMIVSNIMPGNALLVMVTLRTVLLTPVIEEVFWRGYAQDILQKTLNRPFGFLTQAVLFALMHTISIPGRIQIFFLGFLLGIWRWRKRTLIPLITVHMFVNSLWCFRYWHDQLELRMIRTTHDYQVQLEELCKPSDYMPEKNALSDYTQAFELLVERPKGLQQEDLSVWPNDLSPEKVSLLCNWISSNRIAIGEFELGTLKPYYYREYGKESFKNVISPPFSEAINMVFVVSSRAQISAMEDNFQQSVSDILMCYRFGKHLEGPKPLIEQLIGMGVKQRTIFTTLRIMERSLIDSIYLREFQSGLKSANERSIAPIDFSGERLICHDYIQRVFTENGTGEGHIPRLMLKHMMNPPDYLKNQGIPLLNEGQVPAWEKLKRRQTTQLTDEVFAYLDSIKDRTPVELHRTEHEVEDIVRQYAKHNALLSVLIPAFVKPYHVSYRLKARESALIVTIAIMRYTLDNGNLPDELGQLVRAGYIESLPLDPYSNAPFVYRKMGLDFLLYSFGQDFDDDGGIRSSSENNVGGDDVFWPLEYN